MGTFLVMVWPFDTKNPFLDVDFVEVRACCEHHAADRVLEFDGAAMLTRAFDAPNPN